MRNTIKDLLKLNTSLFFIFFVLFTVLPEKLLAFSNISKLSVGGYHNIALKTDGTLWAWGFNSSGQLGDNTQIDRYPHVQVGADNTWISIAAGYRHTIAVKTSGTLWAWGDDWYGQLGIGSKSWRFSPFQIGTDTDWSSIAAGGYHTISLKTDGTLWAWGFNSSGQLGDNTQIDRYSPVQVGTDTDWASIAAGSYHTAAVKSDGSLWAWGLNYYCQLGDNTQIDRYSPVQIGTDTDWVSIAAGGFHTIALKDVPLDGTSWAWGLNFSGQLGDTFFPVKIVGVTPDYSTLQIAYDDALDEDIIQSQAVTFNEDFYIDRDPPISVILKVGYDCSYSNNTGITTINGNMEISNGTVTIQSGTLTLQ
jgi:alpha-tubulin suppressor-like RCC1 family protein